MRARSACKHLRSFVAPIHIWSRLQLLVPTLFRLLRPCQRVLQGRFCRACQLSLTYSDAAPSIISCLQCTSSFVQQHSNKLTTPIYMPMPCAPRGRLTSLLVSTAGILFAVMHNRSDSDVHSPYLKDMGFSSTGSTRCKQSSKIKHCQYLFLRSYNGGASQNIFTIKSQHECFLDQWKLEVQFVES
jgi:hypothetical protein